MYIKESKLNIDGVGEPGYTVQTYVQQMSTYFKQVSFFQPALTYYLCKFKAECCINYVWYYDKC